MEKDRNKAELLKKIPLLKVIITTNNDYNYKYDIKMLKSIYIKVTNRFSSGTGTIDFLKFNSTHLVIADIEIADMNIITFLKRVRRDIKKYLVPIIVISSNSEKEFVLDVIAAGCSGFIIRPYSISVLLDYILYALEQSKFMELEEEAINMATSEITKGNFDSGIEILEEIVEDTKESEAESFFQKGTEYLLNKKYNLAIIAFNKALKLNNLMIKCYTGLAEAYKGKGDMERYKYYLQKAADEYAKRDNFEEVKELFIKILKTDPNAPNPYNTLGIQFRKKQKYGLAIKAYSQAIKLNPNDENIHYNMAKALFFAKEYTKSLKFIKNALRLNPNFSEASLLEKEVLKHLEK